MGPIKITKNSEIFFAMFLHVVPRKMLSTMYEVGMRQMPATGIAWKVSSGCEHRKPIIRTADEAEDEDWAAKKRK